MPLFDVLPGDPAVKEATAFLLDQLRNKRFEDEKAGATPTVQGNGEPLPAAFGAGKEQVRVPVPSTQKPKPRVEREGEKSESDSGLVIVDKRGKR
jgi:hypothetical protein